MHIRVGQESKLNFLTFKIDPLCEAVFFVLMAIVIFVIWDFSYFPSTDGSTYINTGKILHDIFFDPASRNGEFYEFRKGTITNLTIFLFISGLSPFFTPSFIERLIVSVLILLPISIFYYSYRVSERKNAFILLSIFPFCFPASLYGSYNFLLGQYIGLGIFTVTANLTREYRGADIFTLGFFWLVLGITHPAATVVWVVAYGALLLGQLAQTLRSIRIRSITVSTIKTAVQQIRLWIPALAMAPALGMIAAFVALANGHDNAYKRPLILRLRELAIQYELFTVNRIEIYVALALSLTIVGLIVAKIYPLLKKNEWKKEDAILFSAAIMLVFYLAAPDQFGGGNSFVTRVSLIPAMLALLWLGRKGFGFFAQMTGAALFLAMSSIFLAGVWTGHRDLNVELVQFARLSDQIAPRSVVLPLITTAEPRSHGKADPLRHFYNLLAAENGAVFLLNWNAHYPGFPIQYRPGKDPYTKLWPSFGPESLARFERDADVRVDYVLIWDATRSAAESSPAILESFVFEGFSMIGTEGTGTALLSRH